MDLADAERRCIALPLAGEDAEALNVLFGEYGRRGGKMNQQAAAIERVRQLADEAAVEQELLWPDQVIAALDGR